jgi:hypothetical protein
MAEYQGVTSNECFWMIKMLSAVIFLFLRLSKLTITFEVYFRKSNLIDELVAGLMAQVKI